jgi:hypothetical protein
VCGQTSQPGEPTVDVTLWAAPAEAGLSRNVLPKVLILLRNVKW